jgi:hypothetical protein
MKVFLAAILLSVVIGTTSSPIFAKSAGKQRTARKHRITRNVPSKKARGGSDSKAAPAPDGVVMSNSKVAVIKGKVIALVEDGYRVSERITAWPNGDVELSDGRKLHLEEGQLLTLDGKLMAFPQRLNVLSLRSIGPQNDAPLPKK